VPVPEVMKVSEAVSWKVRAMTERMYAPRSAGHPDAVHAAEAVHAARELCMPPKPLIEGAGNVAGAASIANTTAHTTVILRSMRILSIVTRASS
jgi:hypothetical protein